MAATKAYVDAGGGGPTLGGTNTWTGANTFTTYPQLTSGSAADQTVDTDDGDDSVTFGGYFNIREDLLKKINAFKFLISKSNKDYNFIPEFENITLNEVGEYQADWSLLLPNSENRA